MKKNIPTYSAFTLIEIIVSLTIFSLIMVSVMSIFYLASQMSTRVEMQREMQGNIKNILDILAEDVRKNGIYWGEDIAWNCLEFLSWNTVNTKKLCIWDVLTQSEYSLGKKDTSGDFYRNYDCSDIESQCYVIKKDTSWVWYPLSDNMSHIADLQFYISNSDHKKVTIAIKLRPAFWKGIKPELLETNTLNVQTTFSQRFISQQ